MLVLRFLRRIPWLIRRSTMFCITLAVGVILGVALTATVTAVFHGKRAAPQANATPSQTVQQTPATPGYKDALAAAGDLMEKIARSMVMSPQQRADYLKGLVDPAMLADTVNKLNLASATLQSNLGVAVNGDDTGSTYVYSRALEQTVVSGPTPDNTYTVQMILLQITGNSAEPCSRALDVRGLTKVVVKHTPSGWLYVSSLEEYAPQVLLHQEDKVGEASSCFANLITEYHRESGQR